MRAFNKYEIRALGAAVAVALVAFGGCKNASNDDPDDHDVDAIVSGAQDDDGAKTATFLDGAVRVDDEDDLAYLFSGLSGEGKFEVKSNAAWANVTADVASVVAAGSDKMAKFDLELQGSAAVQYEVAYNIGDPKDITGKTVSFKIYVPEAYAAAGETAYPMVSLWTKTSGWTGTKFAELNTLTVGSGWKTVAVDFDAEIVTVDGVAVTAGTGETVSFSAANLANLADTKLIVVGFYAESIPATMLGSFYLDWLDVSGFATPVLAAPAISVDSNEVTITAAEGATIHYTVDSAEPTSASAEYTAPFSITADTTVKAIAVMDGYTTSAVATKLCEFADLASDLTLDADTADFKFASDIAAGSDDGSTFGASGSRFSWAKETAEGSDGVLVIEGVDAAPAEFQKSCFTIQLPAAAAAPASISIRMKVGAAYVADWYQYVKVAARLGEGWTWTEYDSLFKFPQDGFTADAWKTLTLDAADFNGDSIADLRAITLEIGRDYAGGAAAIDDILIDWVDVQ